MISLNKIYMIIINQCLAKIFQIRITTIVIQFKYNLDPTISLQVGVTMETEAVRRLMRHN